MNDKFKLNKEMKMKKMMMIVVLAAMTMGAVSCGDDDPIREDKLTFGVTDVITKTVTGDNFFDYDGSKLRFDLNYMADTACLQVLDTKFAKQMPLTVNMTFNAMNISYTARDRYLLTGTNYQVMDGYTVNNIRCNADLLLKTYYLTYDVVTSRATSKVYVYPENILSTLADENLNYATANELYFKFNCALASDSSYKGDVCVYHVKFAEAAPLLTIRIPYDEHVTITGTKTGYTVEGTGITGKYLQGTTEVPFERSTIDNLKIEVDVVNKSYSISFNCMGGEFTSDGKLYL